MKTQILIVLSIIAITSLVHGKSPAQFFCGRRLANTLALFCSYDEVSKRSRNSIENAGSKGYDFESNKVFGDEDDMQWRDLLQGERMKREAEVVETKSSYDSFDTKDLGDVKDDSWKTQMLQGFRHKRGVVSECCDQPCTLEELLTYC